MGKQQWTPPAGDTEVDNAWTPPAGDTEVRIEKKNPDGNDLLNGVPPSGSGSGGSPNSQVDLNDPFGAPTRDAPTAVPFVNQADKDEALRQSRLQNMKEARDAYAASPSNDPAVVKSLSKNIPDPNAHKYSFGDNEYDWLKATDTWLDDNVVNPILRPAEAFVYNHAFLPVYQNSVGLVNKVAAGAADLLNDAGHKSLGVSLMPDAMRDFFDSATDEDKKMKTIGNGKDGLAGEVTEGIAGTLPLFAALPEAAAEAAGAKLADVYSNIYASAAYKAITAPIVKLFATTGAAEAYHESSAAGNDITTSAGKGIEGAITGGESGLELEGQMLIGGAFSKTVANQLAQKGLLVGGKPMVALLHSLALGTVFGGSSAAEGIINGQDPETIYHEALKQFAVGAAFGIPEVAGEIGNKIQEARDKSQDNTNIARAGLMAKVVQEQNHTAIVQNLMGFKLEDIQKINSSPVSTDQLYAASLEVGAKAYEESDPQGKKNLMLQQLSLKNQGDIKRATETIVQDPKAFLNGVFTSDLPVEDKVDLLNKVTQINKSYNPVELEKTDIGKTINDLSDQIKTTQNNIAATADQGDKSAHYVSLNDLVGKKVEAMNKLFEISREQQAPPETRDREQIGLLPLEEQRQLAHDGIRFMPPEQSYSPSGHYVSSDIYGGPIGGNSEAEVHKRIDVHFDQRVNEEKAAAGEVAPSGPTPEQQAHIDNLEAQRATAHAGVVVNENNENSHHVPDTDFKGNSADQVKSQIDKHYDGKIEEVSSGRLPAGSEQTANSKLKTEPGGNAARAAGDMTDIKPQALEKSNVGEAHIIGVKDDGSVTLKMDNGTVEDVPKEDHEIAGISMADVRAFKENNGIKEVTPETVNDHIQDLAERIHAGRGEFSHADSVLYKNYADEVNAALLRMENGKGQESRFKNQGPEVRGSDAELEKRMGELEDAKDFTPERDEYNRIEKEMEKRERASVFSVPLDKASDAIDALIKKNKEMPNGYGAFIEKRDARESKAVISRYIDGKNLSDKDIKSDFKNAFLGHPDTWYADGLKLRESANLAAERNINVNDLLGEAEKEFTKDGYDSKVAKEIIADRLRGIVLNKNDDIGSHGSTQRDNGRGVQAGAGDGQPAGNSAEDSKEQQPDQGGRGAGGPVGVGADEGIRGVLPEEGRRTENGALKRAAHLEGPGRGIDPGYKRTIEEKLSVFDEQIKDKKFPNVTDLAERVLPREFAEKFKSLYETADRNGLHIDIRHGALPGDAVGGYHGGFVVIDPYVSMAYEDNWNEFVETLNHEIIHGLIEKGVHDEHGLHKDLLPVYNRVLEERINNPNLSDRIKDLIGYIEKTTKKYEPKSDYTRADFATAPKAINLEELVTYAFTDPEFANFLDSLPYQGIVKETVKENKLKTIFSHLKDIIREYIGKLAGKSALDDINEVVNKYFDPSENERNIAARNERNRAMAEMKGAMKKPEAGGGKPEEEKDTTYPQRKPGEGAGDYTKRVREFLDAQKQVMDAAKDPNGPQLPPPPVANEEHQAPKWEAPADTKEAQVKRKIGDNYNRIEVLQHAIEMAGGIKLDDTMDYHNAVDLQAAKIAQRSRELREKFVKSEDKANPAFFERMHADGIEKGDFDKYIQAAHVGEFNKAIGEARRAAYEEELKRLEKNRHDAEVEGNHPRRVEYYERAIKEMVGQKNERYPLMDDGASGMTNAEAKAILDKFAADGKTPGLEKYADEYNKTVSKEQLRDQVDSGLISQEEADRLNKKYPNYVSFQVASYLEPLHEEGPIKRNSSKKLVTVDKVLRKAQGAPDRKMEERVDPSAYGLVQLEKAYTEGEVNKTANVLYNLVEQNPNDSVFQIVNPRYSPVKRGDGTMSHFAEITPREIVNNSIQLYRNGRKVYIHIKDPLMRRAVGKLGVVKSVKQLAFIQNALSTVRVKYSPEFWVTNSMKHVGFAAFNLSTEGKGDIAMQMLKNSVPAMKAAFDYEHGKRGGDWAPWVERYLQSGAKLSGIAPATDAEKVESIQKSIAEIGQKKNIAQNTRAILDYVATLGDASGVGPRLAVFRAAAERGMTDQQAAALSREASINFNKKGEWSPFAANLYFMINAHLQGTVNIYDAIKNRPAARKVAAGLVVMGIMNAALRHALAKPDDDPISESDKQNNFLVPNLLGGGAFKIPMPFGVTAPYYLGLKTYEVISGQAKPGEATMGIITNTLNATAPVGHADLLQTVMPTEVLRAGTQYAENKNTFGGPIYKDPKEARVVQPSSESHFASIAPEFALLAHVMNHLSGGTDVKSGFADFSPDVMQWIYNTATGAPGELAQNAGHLAERGYQAAGGPVPESLQLSPMQIKEVPLLRKFYTDGTPVNYKSVIFQTLQNSGNHEIDGPETTAFFNALTGAAVKGQITVKQLQIYRQEFIENVRRMQIGNMLPDENGKVIDRINRKPR